MVKFQLQDGSIVDPIKDCSCSFHDGPHWLWMDAYHKSVVEEFRTAGNWRAVIVEDLARIQEKGRQMSSKGIVRIIREEVEVEGQTKNTAAVAAAAV